MSKATFLIGCPHFGHDNIYKFTRYNGEKVRPYANAAEGDAIMLQRWNEVVRADDKVYMLGDICFENKHLKILGQLNGKKVLIKGNHDKLTMGEYSKYFYDIRATHTLAHEVLSHIPVHPQSLGRGSAKVGRKWLNIHAHLHAERVMLDRVPRYSPVEPDPQYYSVCVEHTNYTPVTIDEIRASPQYQKWWTDMQTTIEVNRVILAREKSETTTGLEWK